MHAVSVCCNSMLIIKISFSSFSNTEPFLLMTSQHFLHGFFGLESSTLGITKLQSIQISSSITDDKKIMDIFTVMCENW